MRSDYSYKLYTKYKDSCRKSINALNFWYYMYILKPIFIWYKMYSSRFTELIRYFKNEGYLIFLSLIMLIYDYYLFNGMQEILIFSFLLPNLLIKIRASVPIPSYGISCKSPWKYLQYNFESGTPYPNPDKIGLFSSFH